jgi:hypothetical protein
MLCKNRLPYAVTTTVTALLFATQYAATCSAERPTSVTAAVFVTTYSCKQDARQPPTVRLLNDPGSGRDKGQAVVAKVSRTAFGVWEVSAQIPVGHWFLRLLSDHCAALIATTSIAGEGRSFATALYPGDATSLDGRERNYVAGTLPFAGATDIYVSADGSPVNAEYPIVEGRYFYFDGLQPRPYFLVINLGGYSISVPIDFGHKSGVGNVQRITAMDIKRAIDSASPARVRP